MLAQSLFAVALPASPADQPSSPQDDGGAFGRLLDVATRPAPEAAPAAGRASARPAPIDASPVDLALTSPQDDGGPEVLPGPTGEAEAPKLRDGEGPQVLPGPAPHRRAKGDGSPGPEICPMEPDQTVPTTIEAKADDVGPLVLPDVEPAVPPAEVLDEDAQPTDAGSAEGAPSQSVTPPVATPAARPGPTGQHDAPEATRRGPVERSALAGAPDMAHADQAPTPPGVETPEPPGLATAEADSVAPPPQPAAAPPPVREATTPQPPALPSHLAGEPPAPAGGVEPPRTDAPAFGLSRVAHATIADLSAQIVRRLEGKFTRFDMALTPEDLGRVDVSLEMGDDGSLTARLNFDTPAAAAEMRGRADELRRQLEQAGFQLARDSLEFGQRDGSSGRHEGFERRSGRAFAAARDLADQAESAPIHLALSLNPARDRVDVKV